MEIKFSKYPKINTLFNRDENHKIILGDYVCPEYALIKHWTIEEKIDGTNIRIHFDGDQVLFGGRTDKAEIQPHLLRYLQSIFTVDKFIENFDEVKNITLFGEGYGHKIQEPMGKAYAGKDVGFCLFDVKIGHWWIERDQCKKIADKFGVSMPPVIEIEVNVDLVIDHVSSGFITKFCTSSDAVEAEGIIARTFPILLDRSGERIMWKLKCRDFK